MWFLSSILSSPPSFWADGLGHPLLTALNLDLYGPNATVLVLRTTHNVTIHV